jgi:mono/diheme cytochrome c family protein
VPGFLLLDEINLARPEYYMWWLINGTKNTNRHSASNPWAVCGTLNIDDTSHVPSPKVVDRSFLLEMLAPRPWSEPPSGRDR